jgi:large subunit ribosomal protein L7/L12
MTEANKEFSADIKELGDKIVGLTLLQAKELCDYLKEVHGIEPAAGGGVVMAAMPGAGGAGSPADAAAEEKNSFDVVLSKVADQTKKIAVIKLVREITGKGLKESKELVDGAPQLVKAAVPRDEAEQLKEKLEAQGATIELK